MTKILYSTTDRAVYSYTQTTGPIKVIRFLFNAVDIAEAVEMCGYVTVTPKSFAHIQQWEEV